MDQITFRVGFQTSSNYPRATVGTYVVRCSPCRACFQGGRGTAADGGVAVEEGEEFLFTRRFFAQFRRNSFRMFESTKELNHFLVFFAFSVYTSRLSPEGIERAAVDVLRSRSFVTPSDDIRYLIEVANSRSLRALSVDPSTRHSSCGASRGD